MSGRWFHPLTGCCASYIAFMKLSVCVTDDDYEAWRAIRIAVLPGERCDTVAELRAQDSPSRLLLLAVMEGVVVGSGMADRSGSAGRGFAAPLVLSAYRRLGVGSGLLRALAEHCAGLGLPELRASVDDEGSLAFADRFGFVEVDRQIEQVRAVGDEQPPSAPPAGVDVVTLSQHEELWAACFDTFGKEVLADFAVYTPLQISARQWNTSWAGDPMFLALYEGEVIGCAGLHRDTDRPERGENALTAVRRDWRGRGIASQLKRRTLQWAAANGLRELYTWTQAGNSPMLRLNEQLGYVTGQISITVSRPLPLPT
jgi:GNAT superfamily N-acetyltransferase